MKRRAPFSRRTELQAFLLLAWAALWAIVLTAAGVLSITRWIVHRLLG